VRIVIDGIGYEEADVPRPLAFDALEAQNATVLSSVVREMDVADQVLAAHQRCGGTAWRNHHPIMVLFASAVARISTGSCGIGTASADDAKRLCRAVTNPVEVPKTDEDVYDRIPHLFTILAAQSEVRKRYDGFRIGGASVAKAWSKTFEVDYGGDLAY